MPESPAMLTLLISRAFWSEVTLADFRGTTRNKTETETVVANENRYAGMKEARRGLLRSRQAQPGLLHLHPSSGAALV